MKRFQILDGSMLKLIALVCMIIDHTVLALLWDSEIILLEWGRRSKELYEMLRYIGRISFPIYAFLLMEGFLHTRNVKRYALNLLVFALLSEIPWNLLHSGSFLYSRQNVMFTLLLGLLGMWAIEEYHDQRKKEACILGALLLVSILLRADYGCSGFGFVLLMYLLREKKLYQAVVGSCFFIFAVDCGTGIHTD